MIKIARDWATPLTIGAFTLMAVTGLLLFFHLDTGLNKAAHEWLGWMMIAAVATHAATNWPGLRRYLSAGGKSRAILVASLAVLALSFVPVSPARKGASPPVLALQALGQAPLKSVAPIAGKSIEQVKTALRLVGLEVNSEDQSLATLTGGDRAALGRAIAALFSPAPAARRPL
jgi:hypothetical protein